MQITIEIRDSYGNGDSFTRTETVAVTPPSEDDNIDGWGVDALFKFTGQGDHYADIGSSHDVKILACADQPDLIGKAFGFGY